MASSSGDHTVRLWSLHDYTCIHTFQGHTCSILSIQFINFGQQLVSGSSDGLVKLWNIKNGECINTFDYHMSKIWTITTTNASSSSNQIITGSSDGHILIWDDFTGIYILHNIT